MRTIVKVLLILTALVCTERFCRWQTDGFRLQKTFGENWQEPPVVLNSDIKELLSQPYTFLGSGVQSYAFLSADGTHVLKLFKHYHLAPRTEFIKKIPLPFWLEGLRLRVLEERTARMNAIFESHKIAFEDLREETGLIHLQLSPSNAPKTTLYDKIHVRHEVDLSQMPFVLQKKATQVFENLSTEKIDALLSAIKNRYKKGIANSDPRSYRNFGFIGEKAIEIDTGSFTKTSHNLTAQELKKELYFETLELRDWLKVNHSELAPYLEQKILYETD